MPQTTYHIDSIKLSTMYHGDAVQVFHVPAAHTDGDSLVYFRHNDVIATGDVFTTTAFPVIDLAHGGTINGVVDALNKILDIAFPEFRLEGGTLVVPGHGRVCDSADVAYYRDLVTIIRDRVQDMKKKGMTLEQVKAQRPTRDYDPRYGSGDQFVDAIYKSLPK
jgi:glyoxylase-like metal-dependent hydrolase (beta-lactamase superfamily II)